MRSMSYRTYDKDKKKNGRFLAILLGALAVLCVLGGVLASYLRTDDFGGNQAAAERFYFTLDLLGDTNDPNKLSTDVHIYGGNSREFPITVQNFFDGQRITAQDITYSITLSSGSGATVTPSGSLTLEGSQASSRVHTVTTPHVTAEAQFTVSIQSSQPYAKTMTVNFFLHPSLPKLSYYIDDEAGSPYATLYLMAGTEQRPAGTVAVNLPNGAENALQVDMTNPFVQVSVGMNTTEWAKSFTNAVPLSINESRAVVLYKLHPEEDHSIGSADLPVAATESNGTFTVNIPQTP